MAQPTRRAEDKNQIRLSPKKRFFNNLKALIDQSAWTLIIIPTAILFFIDSAMVKTMLQWVLMIGIVAGITIMLARIMFPSFSIGEMLDHVRQGNMAAGIAVLGILYFTANALVTVAQWAKP